jgi:serine/threonine protein kinase
MGEVYRGRDPRLAREVAVKVLPAAYSADPDRLQRFEQEARAAAALSDPHLLSVYDFGVHDAAPYIVSELLEGETLRARLDRSAAAATGAGAAGSQQQPLSTRRAIHYAVQIARGLAAAHDKGIVHRDLKPENVFITGDDRVKILDFGLAKLMEPAQALAGADPRMTSHGTQPGVVMGTVGYMAPEQVRGQPADRRSDIFALGALLYEMLVGRRAFAGATTADTLTAILLEDPPGLEVDDHISPALSRVVRRCLEKSPGARFQSAQDLRLRSGSLRRSREPALCLRWRRRAGAVGCRGSPRDLP